jgi:hypothetical protein
MTQGAQSAFKEGRPPEKRKMERRDLRFEMEKQAVQKTHKKKEGGVP